jgi:hypothetical protein
MICPRCHSHKYKRVTVYSNRDEQITGFMMLCFDCDFKCNPNEELKVK